MLTKGFLKPELKLSNIGNRTFLMGILIGLTGSISVNLFYIYSRESIRSISLMSDLVIFSDNIYRFFDLFYASLSVLFGFSIAIMYWFQFSRYRLPRKRNHLRQAIIATACLFMIVPLAWVWRFGSVMGCEYEDSMDMDKYFSIYRDLKILIYLIPVYLFFVLWMYIQRYYRSFKWMGVAFPVLLLLVFIQWRFSRIDKSTLNNFYYEIHKSDFEYIDEQINKAKKENIHFDDQALKILRSYFEGESKTQIHEISLSFRNPNHIVPIDNIILEKILIHNLKYANHIYGWPYPNPFQLYIQILKHDPESLETKNLFEILEMEFNIVQKLKRRDKSSPYSGFDEDFIHRYFYKWRIGSQLNIVIEHLNRNPKFSDRSILITPIILKEDDEILSPDYEKILNELEEMELNRK